MPTPTKVECYNTFFPDERGRMFKATFIKQPFTHAPINLHEVDSLLTEESLRRQIISPEHQNDSIGSNLIHFIVSCAVHHAHLFSKDPISPGNVKQQAFYNNVVKNWQTLDQDCKDFLDQNVGVVLVNASDYIHPSTDTMSLQQFSENTSLSPAQYRFFPIWESYEHEGLKISNFPVFARYIPLIPDGIKNFNMTTFVTSASSVVEYSKVVLGIDQFSSGMGAPPVLGFTNTNDFVVKWVAEMRNTPVVQRNKFLMWLYCHILIRTREDPPANITHNAVNINALSISMQNAGMALHIVTDINSSTKFYNGVNWPTNDELNLILSERLTKASNVANESFEDNLAETLKLKHNIELKECFGNTLWKVYDGLLYQVVDDVDQFANRDPEDPRFYKYMFDNQKKCYSTNVNKDKCTSWLLNCVLSNDPDKMDGCLEFINGANMGAFDFDFKKVCDTHPDLIMATLKKFNFKLVNETGTFLNKIWRMQTLDEWVLSGGYKKIFAGKTDKDAFDALKTSMDANPKFYAYLVALVSAVNRNVEIISQNVGKQDTVPYEAGMPHWVRNMTPLVVSSRRRISSSPLPDIIRLRSTNKLNSHISPIQFAINDSLSPINLWSGSSFFKQKPVFLMGGGENNFCLTDVCLERVPQSGGARLVAQNPNVIPVGYKVVKVKTSDKFKDMYVQAKRRATNSGVVIVNEEKMTEKLNLYNSLHEDIMKTLNAINEFVDVANSYGFVKGTRISLNNIIKLANHYNLSLRKYAKTEDVILSIIQSLHENLEKGDFFEKKEIKIGA